MAHESTWLASFEKSFRAIANTDYAVRVRWSKFSVDSKRGVPDTHIYCSAPIGYNSYAVPAARQCTFGPGAWLEAKRGHAWPTKAQAAKLAHCGVIGEPAYLLRMRNKANYELYTINPQVAEELGCHQPPFRELYGLVFAGSHDLTAQCLVHMMVHDTLPAFASQQTE